MKLDDRFPTNPKITSVGSAPLAVYVRGLCFAAQHSTDGHISGALARTLGTKLQIGKLVSADLWHSSGHVCPRCPQPPAGSYYVHDFLHYQPSRAEVERRRKADAERQRHQRRRGGEQRRDASGEPGRGAGGARESRENFPNFRERPGHGAASRRDSQRPVQSSPGEHLAVLSLPDVASDGNEGETAAAARGIAHAWARAYEANHDHPVHVPYVEQIQQQALTLMAEGCAPSLLAEAVTEMGRQGWRDIARHLAARDRSPVGSLGSSSPGDWRGVHTLAVERGLIGAAEVEPSLSYKEVELP
ncbi:hypothetical protein [Streptomyces luteireticuli]|uniref:hypothetical protein n=1 Tax=Streptomyces luteireticuli TaxID=173858 RepID=UPI0031DC7955